MADRVSAYLKQLSSGTVQTELLPPFEVSNQSEIVIGRDPKCQIALEPFLYTMVSRRHCVIRRGIEGDESWEICDLNSANGTYLNGRQLIGCKTLQARAPENGISSGDRVKLGKDGPEFVFEHEEVSTQVFSPPPPPTPTESVTFTQLFPLAATGRDLTQKAYLVPAIFTIIFVVSLFTAVGSPLAFNLILATYLSAAAYYFVYSLCGKRKPWWALVSSGVITALILISPLLIVFIFIFRGILPGNVANLSESTSFPALLITMFFGAGLMEELLKAVPILLAYAIGKYSSSGWAKRIGVSEPLDGILLGTASAIGFTLIETLGQYVPDIINDVTLQAGEGAGQLVGLQLLIPRLLGSVAGHMAYSGYLGYFIGLSVLKPSRRWQILGIGYLSASFLHALWNATGFYSSLLLALVGIISYAFLAAAILKARQLSPTRTQNFATRIK